MISQEKENQSYIEIDSIIQNIDIYSNLERFIEKGNQEFDYERLKDKGFKIPTVLTYYDLEVDSMKSRTIWMRSTLKNQTQDDLLYYFIVRHAYLYKGTVFIVSKNNVEELHTYNYQNINVENRYSNFPTWKIPIPKNSEIKLYIKVYETGGRTRISSLLKEERQFLDHLITTFGVHSAFVLFILIIVFFAVYISRYTKRTYVLFYAFYVLFLCIDYISVHGIGQSYIWTDSYFLLRNVRSMSNASSGLFLCLFFAYFYNSYKYPIWVKKTFSFGAIVFGIFIILYCIKFFTGGLSSLFLYVWKAISFFSMILIGVHSYLALKKIIPLYLPIVFVLHIGVSYINSNYVFPYSSNSVFDWFLMNILYVSLVIEVIVWTYFIFNRLKKEKLYLLELEEEVLILQEKLDQLKHQHEHSSLHNELIHLKSKAVLNSQDILYIKSDGHYVEYYVNNKKTPEIDRNSLMEVLNLLPSSSFVRIHKSYIVNIYRIKIINSTKLMLDNGEWLNLSRTYKQKLKDILHPGE